MQRRLPEKGILFGSFAATFMVGLCLLLLTSCATTGPSPKSLQETLVSTYEGFGRGMNAIKPILMTLEATQVLKGNDLAVAKKIYNDAVDRYHQAGEALNKFIKGTGTQQTYSDLLNETIQLLNQVNIYLSKGTSRLTLPERDLMCKMCKMDLEIARMKFLSDQWGQALTEGGR